MKTFQKQQFFENYLKMKPVDEKFWKNTHLSKNIHVIQISKSQSQIYNISLQNGNFPKILGFEKFI